MNRKQRARKLRPCCVPHEQETEKTTKNKDLQKWQVLEKVMHYELSLSTTVTVTTTAKSRRRGWKGKRQNASNYATRKEWSKLCKRTRVRRQTECCIMGEGEGGGGTQKNSISKTKTYFIQTRDKI